MHDILLFFVGLMSSWVPAAHNDTTRYASIAQDALDVSAESDWLGFSAEETAVVLLSIASFESGFRADIDKGKVRGDGGKSVCLGQVQLPTRAKREQVAASRKECFRVMLERVAASWDWCHKLPLSERLSGYTVGKCVKSKTSRKYTRRLLDGIDAVNEFLPVVDWDVDPLTDPDADLYWPDPMHIDARK